MGHSGSERGDLDFEMDLDTGNGAGETEPRDDAPGNGGFSGFVTNLHSSGRFADFIGKPEGWESVGRSSGVRSAGLSCALLSHGHHRTASLYQRARRPRRRPRRLGQRWAENWGVSC